MIMRRSGKRRMKNLLLVAAFTAAAASGALVSNVHKGEAWGGWWGPWEPENYWDPVGIGL